MIALMLLGCTIVLVDIPCEDTAPTRWSAISAGGLHGCGIDIDGALQCWGRDVEGQSTPPEGSFASVASGYHGSCAADEAGGIVCWGGDEVGETSPPAGTFEGLAVGGGHACAVGADATLSCWGRDAEGQLELSGRPAVAVAAGSIDTCLVTPTGFLDCAIGNPSLADVPSTQVVAVSLGLSAGCAIGADGALSCWGEGPAATPPGSTLAWQAVGMGADFACALDAAGTIACWGNDDVGQASPPTGEFVSLDADADGRHACAVDIDGLGACWGLATEDQTDVP